MRTLLLLVISCCLLLFGGQEASDKKASTDNPLVTFSTIFHYFNAHHAIKNTRLKKSSPVSHEQSDSFTEADEDLSFNRHLELQVKDLFLFSVAFVWTSRPAYIKMPLPFSWSSAAALPSKYILQRVLRI